MMTLIDIGKRYYEESRKFFNDMISNTLEPHERILIDYYDIIHSIPYTSQSGFVINYIRELNNLTIEESLRFRALKQQPGLKIGEFLLLVNLEKNEVYKILNKLVSYKLVDLYSTKFYVEEVDETNLVFTKDEIDFLVSLSKIVKTQIPVNLEKYAYQLSLKDKKLLNYFMKNVNFNAHFKNFKLTDLLKKSFVANSNPFIFESRLFTIKEKKKLGTKKTKDPQFVKAYLQFLINEE